MFKEGDRVRVIAYPGGDVEQVIGHVGTLISDEYVGYYDVWFDIPITILAKSAVEQHLWYLAADELEHIEEGKD